MSDIQHWEDTLTDEIETIQRTMEGLDSIRNPVEKAAAIDKLEKKVKMAMGTKRAYKMETRLVNDVDHRRACETRLHRLDQTLIAIQGDVKALKSQMERGELFVEADGDGEQGTEADPTLAGDKLLQQANTIQDKTQASIENTTQMIAQSKEVGKMTLEELNRQREVINSTEKQQERVNDNLARSEALIKHFGKRIASDKFIQAFAVMNCLLLAGVIVYAVLRQGGLSGRQNNAPVDPTSPVRHLLLRGDY